MFRFWGMFFFVMITLSVKVFAVASSPYNILILHSYSPDSVWTTKMDRAIKSNLKRDVFRVQVYSEHMDTKRFHSSEYNLRLKEFYFQKFHTLNLDLIITTDDNAFHFVMENRKEIFNNAPVVFTGVNGYGDKRFNDYKKDGNFTGIVESFKIKETIEMALKLHRSAKKIYILNTIHTNSGRYLKKEFRKAFSELNLTQEIIYLEDYYIEDLYIKLKNLEEGSFALFGGYSRDRRGTFLDFEKSLKMMSQNSYIPIYGFLEYYLPYGLTGGYLTSAKVYGELAAELANRIIKGERASDIEVITDPPTPIVFNYKLLNKHQLDIAKLPKGARVINQRNKLQNFYYEYTIEFWIIVLAFICLFISIFVLFYYFYQQKKHKHAVVKINEQLEKRVEDRTKQLIEQQSKLINSAKLASIGEMASGIAHEINNPLTIIDLSAHRIKQNADNDIVLKSANKIKDTVVRITKIIQGLKQLSKEDNSFSGELVDIREAIEDVISICKDRFRSNDIDFHINIEKDLRITGGAVQISQVVLNLLNNSFDELVSSNGPRWVRLEGRIKDNFVEITVTDSGHGIPEEIRDRIMEPFFTTKVDKKGTGLGLSICKNIIEHHRGKLFVDDNSVNTRFVIQIPRVS